MYGIINYEMFLLTAILLNITPGPDTMFIVSRSVSQGKMAGIYSALGISAGTIIHTLLAAFGLSVILMKSTFLFQVIKIIGAVYLAYLGLRMLTAKNENHEQKSIIKQGNAKIFFQGMLANLTNPKVALFFLAFIPQFIHAKSGVASPVPFIILGLTYTFTGVIWCLIMAYFSSMATNKVRSHSRVGTALNRLTGIIFIVMGVALFNTKATS